MADGPIDVGSMGSPPRAGGGWGAVDPLGRLPAGGRGHYVEASAFDGSVRFVISSNRIRSLSSSSANRERSIGVLQDGRVAFEPQIQRANLAIAAGQSESPTGVLQTGRQPVASQL